MHHTLVGSPPAFIRTGQDWHYSPPTKTPSGCLSNHPRAPRVETPLLWHEYNDPPDILQGNPIPAGALLHIHQFAAVPPNIFIPPPVVHPQGPALNHFMAGPHTPPPMVHQPPPPPFLIGGHQHTHFMPPPPGPQGGQHPHPPMQPSPPGPHAPLSFAASHQYLTLGAPYLYYIVQQAALLPVQNDGDSKAAKPDKFTGKDLRKLRLFISSCIMYFNNKPFNFKNDQQQVSYSASFLSKIALLWWQPHLMAFPKPSI